MGRIKQVVQMGHPTKGRVGNGNGCGSKHCCHAHDDHQRCMALTASLWAGMCVAPNSKEDLNNKNLTQMEEGKKKASKISIPFGKTLSALSQQSRLRSPLHGDTSTVAKMIP